MKLKNWRMAVPMAAVFLPVMLAACAAAPREPAAVFLDSTPSQAGPFVNAHAILIVRHGDIDAAQKKQMGDQAPLTQAGQERAKALAFALHDAGITRIVAAPALRTQQTSAPLAAALKITPETLVADSDSGAVAPGANASGTERESVAQGESQNDFEYLARTAKPTDTILVVEHHSVVGPLMVEFGFTHETKIDDATEFDRLYLLLPDAQHHTYQLFRLRYGGDWGRAAAGQ